MSVRSNDRNTNTNMNINLDEKNKELEEDYKRNKCNDDLYSKECNNLLLKKEALEGQILTQQENTNDIYPLLDDPNFIVKIAEKKEFSDNKYDGAIHEIKEYAEKMNANLDFQLTPHQSFVKNFLSFQTPYNSLLLYHGLGTGKTCSAIGVCEEQRDYYKQMGISSKIIIIASPNVQDNFRLQLFDERQLKQTDGHWNITGCVGNKLLKEVNPMNMKGLTKEKIVTQINILISKYYSFKGYQEFANNVEQLQNVVNYKSEKERRLKIQRRLKYEFEGKLIVIDEVHNLNEDKKMATQLIDIVSSVSNLRLLLLSATPMYNSHKEIIWLLNLMNMNDNRGLIKSQDVFNKNGTIKESGKVLLINKARGYISFVRGENPYTFPYRVYPNIFSPENTFEVIKYPSHQMNGKLINIDTITPMLLHNIYQTQIGEYQLMGYNIMIDSFQNSEDGKNMKFEQLDSFGFSLLQKPLEALIIVYPSLELERYYSMINNENTQDKELFINIKDIISSRGLSQIMDYVDTKTPLKKGDFEYKPWVLNNPDHGRIFSQDKIGKYSSKIKNICDSIYSPVTDKVSDGVILIYCQYIDSGLLPMALALEEMGFSRYGDKAVSLFKKKPTELVDVKTMKATDKKNANIARYAMITGDPRLSPDNDYEIKAATSENNKDGRKIKVILISRAASEGIDLKFIRQIHIMDPWYNFNRIEQIIGRGIRNYSHTLLPFEKRNVMLYLYGTLLPNDVETADNYVYRLASYKAIQIGAVSRLLKETAVDCIINSEQTNFTQEKISKYTNEKVKQKLSNDVIIKDFKVGDIPYSFNCDYTTCDYKCVPTRIITKEDINEITYDESFINSNLDKIQNKIKDLFKENFFYTKDKLIHKINTPKPFPISQIYAALTQLIQDNNEVIIDKYEREGHLINIDEYYLYQPKVLNNNNISLFDRSVPIDFKFNNLVLDIEKTKKIDDNLENNDTIDVYQDIINKYNLCKSYVDDTDKNIIRGDNDWYKHCGIVIRFLNEEKIISSDEALTLLIHHLIDMLVYNDKLKLLNYIYGMNVIEDDTLEYKIKLYLDTLLVITKRDIAIVLYEDTTKKVKLLKNKKWIDAQLEDIKDVDAIINEKNDRIKNINNLCGLIIYDNKKDIMTFKYKYMNETTRKSSGRKCMDADKQRSLQVLNELYGEEKYNKETSRGLVAPYLCSMEEMLFRYYNKIEKDGKYWFFNYEQALMLEKELYL